MASCECFHQKAVIECLSASSLHSLDCIPSCQTILAVSWSIPTEVNDPPCSVSFSRTMRPLWENRISPNVIYSMQHLCSDTHTLVAGGIDGVLRILDQNTGKVVSGCVMDDSPAPTSSQKTDSIIERKKGRRITEDTLIDSIPKSSRPPITCLAVGMQKVVTTHNGKYIRMWKFHKEQTLEA